MKCTPNPTATPRERAAAGAAGFGVVLVHLHVDAFERLDAHATHRRLLDLLQRPHHERADRLVVAGHGEAVGQPAGRLHEARGREIGLVQHHPWREAHEASATIGLDHDDTPNA